MASPLFVIDSSPAVQRLVEQASSANGYEVVGFKDGKSALEAVQRLRPEVIIADYHLDSMAFPELCDGLRGNDLSSHTPIIALLSASDRPDEKHLKDLGVKAFLKKPLQPEDLVEAIRKVRRAVPPKGSPAEPASSGSEPPKPAVQLRADSRLDAPQPEPPPHSERLVTRIMEPPSAKGKGSSVPADSQPPVETSSNAEASDALDSAVSPPDDTGSAEKPPSAPSFQLATEPAAKSDPEPSLKTGSSLDDPLQSLVSRLLDATAERAEQTLTQRIQSLVAQEVRSQINQGGGTDVARTQGEALSQEQITSMVQETAQRTIPDLLTHYLADIESTLLQNATTRMNNLVGELTGKLGKDPSEDALRKQLPDLLKEPGGALDQLVKEAVEEALSRHLRPVAEEMFRDVGREVAQEVISSMVHEIVPSVAETEIKKEIERLTSSA